MKIYTKTGDNGTTALIGGERVKKNNLHIEAYGTIDELNSFIGLLRDQTEIVESEVLLNQLIHIQHILFTLGSQLAIGKNANTDKIPALIQQHTNTLENFIDRLSEQTTPLTGFIIPGGSQCISLSHIARTICRRAERRIVELSEHTSLAPEIGQYINRLSDYFFILARFLGTKSNINEIIWQAVL